MYGFHMNVIRLTNLGETIEANFSPVQLYGTWPARVVMIKGYLPLLHVGPQLLGFLNVDDLS